MSRSPDVLLEIENPDAVYASGRRQDKLSLWLQRRIESPQMDLPDVMASLSLHYQHSSTTSDEVMLIELKV